MYAKLFASLYQGTLRGQSDAILVFTNLLAHTSKDGVVDKHFRAIAEETGLPIERVRQAIDMLEAPDPESRSPDENGARIVRMDEHRVWGWRVVNHAKYRAIRSEEDRAEQNRLAQKRWRERNYSKQSKPPSAEGNTDKPMQRQMQRHIHNSSPDGFEEFWSAYPRKAGKGAARKKFEVVAKTIELSTLLKAIEAQKKSDQWRKDGGQFIPHPSTWLAQERWNDKPPETAPGRNRPTNHGNF